MLELARQAVVCGVGHAPPPSTLANGSIPPLLMEPRATFVTLEKNNQLRGCMGSLEAYRPLIEDLTNNAIAAALEDPRFPPLCAEEIPELLISISILSPPEPLAVKSEEDLLEVLQPGVDGLILEEGHRRATFLPSVWKELPRARDFVRHLKRKGGWPEGYWSPRMTAKRYGSVYLSEKEIPG